MFFWCRPDFEGVLAPPQINKRAVVISTNAQAICGGANGFLIAGFPQTPATFLQSQKKNNKKNRPLEFNALKKKQSISATARTDYGWLLFRFQKRRQLPNKKKRRKKPPPPKKKRETGRFGNTIPLTPVTKGRVFFPSSNKIIKKKEERKK